MDILVPSTLNLADMGTEPLGTLVYRHLIGPYLFWYPQHLKEAKGKDEESMNI